MEKKKKKKTQQPEDDLKKKKNYRDLRRFLFSPLIRVVVGSSGICSSGR
jgi:hypothetical protein